MLKVFISQKMNGLTTKEIQERRDYILDLFCEEKMIDSIKCEIVNPIVRPNMSKEATRLEYLGEAIKDMAKAEVIIFDDGASWSAKGCMVEADVVRLYKDVYHWTVWELSKGKFKRKYLTYKETSKEVK